MNLSVKYENHRSQKSTKHQKQEFDEIARKLEKGVQNENKIRELTQAAFESPETSVLSINAVFRGNKEASYKAMISKADERDNKGNKAMYTLHYQNSNVNQKQSRLAVLVGTYMSSSLENFNAEDALNSNAKGEAKIYAVYHQNDKVEAEVSMNVNMKESSARNKYLRSKPEAAQCRNEMSQGNNLMPACQSVFFQAQVMDQYKMQAELKEFGPKARNFTNKVLNYVRSFTYENLEENWVNPSQQHKNRIDAQISLEPDFSMVNVSINAPKADIQLKDYEVNPDIAEYVAVRQEVSPVERWSFEAFQRQYSPYCTVDRSQVNTFSNLTYNYKLGNCWHIVMSSQPDDETQTHILMKNPGPNQAEIMVIHREGDSKPINVNMNSQGMKIDNQKYQKLSEKNYIEKWDDQKQNILLRASGDKNRMLVEIGNNALFMYFDNDRLYITASQKYRNRTRGICGGMSGWKGDHVTPKNCYMNDDALTAATWVADERCEGEAKDLAQQANMESCVSRDYYQSSIYVPSHYGEEENRFEYQNNKKRQQHNNNNSDEDESHEKQERKNHQQSLRETKVHKPQGKSLQRQHQYYEENNKICVTKHALPACPDNTQSKGLSQIKANVVCKNKNDQDWNEIKQQIKNGENPSHKLDSHKANDQAHYLVPLNCQA